jgi:hypothetical protein
LGWVFGSVADFITDNLYVVGITASPVFKLRLAPKDPFNSRWRQSEVRLDTACVLAIGINQYANPEFNLAFAAPDAIRLSETRAFENLAAEMSNWRSAR